MNAKHEIYQECLKNIESKEVSITLFKVPPVSFCNLQAFSMGDANVQRTNKDLVILVILLDREIDFKLWHMHIRFQT